MEVKFNWSKIFDAQIETTDNNGSEKIFRQFTSNQLEEIKNYVRACEIAEFIMDNHNIKDEPTAIVLGIEIRDLMFEDEIPEEEAIYEVLEKNGLWTDDDEEE